MTPDVSNTLKDRAAWCSQFCGAAFLITHTYMRSVYVFESRNVGRLLLLISLITALLTLLAGLFALPRWQSFVALAIFAYAFYALGFQSPYALGCR